MGPLLQVKTPWDTLFVKGMGKKRRRDSEAPDPIFDLGVSIEDAASPSPKDGGAPRKGRKRRRKVGEGAEGEGQGRVKHRGGRGEVERAKAGKGKGSGRGKLPSYAFEADYCDHFETPLQVGVCVCVCVCVCRCVRGLIGLILVPRCAPRSPFRAIQLYPWCVTLWWRLVACVPFHRPTETWSRCSSGSRAF
jgi:hypothetical protein